MFQGILNITFFLLASITLGCTHNLAPEEKDKINALHEEFTILKKEIAVVKNKESSLVDELQFAIDYEIAEIGELKKDAAGFSGGPTLAILESAIATKQNNIALLRERYIRAKYGFPNETNCFQFSNDPQLHGASSNMSSKKIVSSRKTFQNPTEDDGRF